MVVRTQTESLARVRKGVLELYISDHPLDCLTCAANGDCELQDVAGEVGLRDVRYGIRRRQSPRSDKRHFEPVLLVRSVEVHRLFPLRARVRRGAGHVRAHRRRTRLRLRHRRQRGRRFHRFGMRIVRRLRAGVPHCDVDREIGRRPRPTRSRRQNDVRLLRCRLFVQGRTQRRSADPDGSRIRTAARITATRASKDASHGATQRTAIAC